MKAFDIFRKCDFCFRAIILAVLLSLVSVSQAQNCAENLEQATRAYYNGQLVEVEDLLAECLEEGFNKDQRARGYKLLVLSNLFRGKTDEAEAAMLQLLRTQPEFKPGEADPVEFVKLFGSFRTDPVISIGLLSGLNTGNYQVDNQFSAGAEFSEGQYDSKTGFQFGASAVYHLFPFLWLGPEFILEKRIFENTEVTNNLIVTSTEKQLRFEIPLLARYALNLKHITPYLEGGAAINFLLNAETQLVRQNPSRNVQEVEFGFNLDDFRRGTNYKIIVGGGAMKRIKGGFVGLDFRYGWELKNQVEGNLRFKDQELFYTYAYVDDDFKARIFSISFYYLHSFYKPKRLKQ